MFDVRIRPRVDFGFQPETDITPNSRHHIDCLAWTHHSLPLDPPQSRMRIRLPMSMSIRFMDSARRHMIATWSRCGARRGTVSGIEQQSSRANFSSSPWRAAKCWAFPPTDWKTVSIERQFTSAAVLRAEDFYRSCGFQELGVGEHLLPSGVAMACVFMRKTLGATTPPERRSVS